MVLATKSFRVRFAELTFYSMSAANVDEAWLFEALDAASTKHIKGAGGCELLQSFNAALIESTDELAHLTRIEVSLHHAHVVGTVQT